MEGNNSEKLQIIFIADRIELGESDLKVMLKKHHEKRKRQPVRCQKVLGGGTTFYLWCFYLCHKDQGTSE